MYLIETSVSVTVYYKLLKSADHFVIYSSVDVSSDLPTYQTVTRRGASTLTDPSMELALFFVPVDLNRTSTK